MSEIVIAIPPGGVFAGPVAVTLTIDTQTTRFIMVGDDGVPMIGDESSTMTGEPLSWK